MISKETIDRIMETALIEEVISDFVTLKKAGSNYKGLSPFAQEKTPSFVVSPAKQIFKCFSSGKGGNVVTFLMEVEHISYPEALRWLADKYNIEIEEKEQSPEQKQEQSKREALILASKFANTFFKTSLNESDEGKAIGLSYFKERGFRDDIIHKFELGYNPDKWDALYTAAKEASYDIKHFIETGLIKQKDDKYFDFFKGRVMFPIHNITGRVIGFGGRTLKTDKNTAKYFNSPESEIYHKSDVLYGMYQAKQAIVKLDECFLVEGYTDVISMHQSGVENVVASSGTSLTDGQIKLIKRYTKNVSILYDGDAAGIKASFRGIDMLLKAGMNIKVVLFPEGEDPDSFAKKSSAEELRTYISEKAEDFLQFKSDVLIKDTQNDPLKRAETIKEIVKSISVIPDAITRQVYIRECSDIFDIDENTLLREVDSLIFAEDEKIYKQQKKQEQRAKQQNIQVPTSSFSSAPPGFDAPPEIVIYDEDGKPLSVAPAPTQGGNLPGVYSDQNVPETLHQEKGLIEALLAFGENEIGIKVLDENQEEQTVNIPIAWYLVHELTEDDMKFSTPIFQEIFDIYLEAYQSEDPVVPSHKKFINHSNPDIQKLVVDTLASPYELSANWEKHNIFTTKIEQKLDKHISDLTLNFKLKRVVSMIDDLEKQLEKKNISFEEIQAILQQKMLFDQARKKFASLLGIVVGS